MIAISTYAGIDLRGKLLKINPDLPENWKKMKFNLQFKGIRFTFEVAHNNILISVDQDVSVIFKNSKYELLANETKNLKI